MTDTIDEKKPLHILFVGAGAVGCFYASLCHHPTENIHVSLVCRSNYAEVARFGVRLETRSFGAYQFKPHAVYKSIDDAATSSSSPVDGWDYVIVTTKALPDLADTAKDIEPVITKAPQGKSSIVLIQNGIGVEQPYRTRYPTNPIISAVTVVSAEKSSTGVIHQNRWTRISMGSYSDGLGGQTPEMRELSQIGEASARRLAHILKDFGKVRDAETHDERSLQIIRWHKICINGSMNPSAVLSGGVGNADMVQDEELRIHLKACMDEVFAAIALIFGEVPSHLAQPEVILRSIERNKGAKPSMLLDWEAGRPMELEVILGNPVRIARSHGLDMPRLQTLYALLKSASKIRSKAQR